MTRLEVMLCDFSYKHAADRHRSRRVCTTNHTNRSDGTENRTALYDISYKSLMAGFRPPRRAKIRHTIGRIFVQSATNVASILFCDFRREGPLSAFLRNAQSSCFRSRFCCAKLGALAYEASFLTENFGGSAFGISDETPRVHAFEADFAAQNLELLLTK